MLHDNAVIIAGGKSSRMGKDKALLPFGNFDSLAQFQHSRLKKLFNQVYISTKENKFDFEVELIYDRYDDSSPLVALLSIFETLGVESVFVLSVDAPFVSEEVIAYLLKEDKKEIDVIIAKSPSGEQPLCGLYKKSILSAVQAQYKKGNHKLGDLLNLVNTKRLAFEADAPFANLNHPEEYESALKINFYQAFP